MAWCGILLVFPVWILGAVVWWLLCKWPTMQWSPIVWAGTWESMALGFMMQFVIVFSQFFEWLWLNSYGNAFS